MEFLIGRSLTNNVTNLLLDPFVEGAARDGSLDWLGLVEQEPDAGLGNGGLGRLAACFLDSMATMQLPAMGYGLRYEYGMFRQAIEDGWQREQPDNWLRRQDPWEVARPSEAVEVKLGCSFEMHDGQACELVAGRPSTLIGIPFDRPVVGYGGKTINTLRLWSAAAPDYFDFQEFSSGDFVGALVGSIAARSLTRVLYPDDSTEHGAGRCASCRNISWSPARWPISCGASAADNADWSSFPDKVAIQLNDTHPTLAVPELMRILLDEAQSRLGRGLGPHAADPGLHQPHAAARGAREMAARTGSSMMLPRQLEIIFEINRRFLDDVRRRYPGDEARVARMSLIEEGAERQGPHGQPGDRRLAQHQRRRGDPLASCCARRRSRTWPRCFRSGSTTRPTASRRGAGCCWPTRRSSGVITEAIGDGWVTDLGQIAEIEAARRRRRVPRRRSARPSARPSRSLPTGCKRPAGQTVDPDSIFDCQIKRIHEYKRQLLNALRIVVLYNRLRAEPGPRR